MVSLWENLIRGDKTFTGQKKYACHAILSIANQLDSHALEHQKSLRSLPQTHWLCENLGATPLRLAS